MQIHQNQKQVHNHNTPNLRPEDNLNRKPALLMLVTTPEWKVFHTHLSPSLVWSVQRVARNNGNEQISQIFISMVYFVQNCFRVVQKWPVKQEIVAAKAYQSFKQTWSHWYHILITIYNSPLYKYMYSIFLFFLNVILEKKITHHRCQVTVSGCRLVYISWVFKIENFSFQARRKKVCSQIYWHGH